MSYILDALRRADAERSRGSVPGLHAQSLPDAEPAARNYRPIAWIAVGAGAVLVAAAAVVLFGPWRPHGPAGATPPLAPAPELARTDRPDAGPAYPEGATPPARPGELAPAARPVEPPIPERSAFRRAAPDDARAQPGADTRAARTPPAADGRMAPTVADAGRAVPPGVPPRLDRRAEDGRVAVLEPRAAARPVAPTPTGGGRAA
ncbi:MAG: hypothetical protein ACTHL8_03615, partial [Burkholderiaceae bacterium]